MRSAVLSFIAVLAAAAPAGAADLVVQIDQTTRVPLSGSAANVLVGNSSIVDAIVLDRQNLVLVGRGYGLTNVVVLDGGGRTLFNRTVQVSPGNDGRMTLFRGATPNNYTCSPTCERTPMPGEPGAVFDPYNQPYGEYQERAADKPGDAAGGIANAVP